MLLHKRGIRITYGELWLNSVPFFMKFKKKNDRKNECSMDDLIHSCLGSELTAAVFIEQLLNIHTYVYFNKAIIWSQLPSFGKSSASRSQSKESCNNSKDLKLVLYSYLLWW